MSEVQDELFGWARRPARAEREVLRDRERHVVFVREMVKTGNRTKSAVEAGFSERTAASQGSRLMKDPAIQRAIRHERARLRMVTPDLSPERLLQELGCIAYADAGQLVDEGGKLLGPHELDEPTRRAVASIETARGRVKYRLGDKRGSIELIARIKGYMKNEMQVAVTTQLSDEDLDARIAAIAAAGFAAAGQADAAGASGREGAALEVA